MIRTFAVIVIGVLACGCVCGQTAANIPTFEVASVKRNTTGERPSGDLKDDRFTMYNMPMRVLVARAYQVNNDRVVGPAWLDTDGFDIIAKLPPNPPENSLWLMLRNLLAERFQLKVHRDQTPVSVYALVVGKGRPRMHEAAPDSRRSQKCDPRDWPKEACQFQKMTVAELAESLPHLLPRNWFDAPLVDLTGLTGAYDFSLTWTVTDRPPDETAGAPENVSQGAPSLIEAIQEQLGLKIERRKAPADRIVIDHVERVPTEN